MNTFTYKVFIPLLLTNAEGNVYWSRFLEILEEARDDFFRRYHPKLFQSIVAASIVPTQFKIKHIQEVFVGQTLSVHLELEDHGDHFVLKADFKRDSQTVVLASQKISRLSSDNKMIPRDSNKFPFRELVQPIKFSDIGITGAAHWFQFAHWLGYRREEFITKELPTVVQMMDEGLVIVTRETSLELYQPVHIHDKLIVRIRINKIIGLKMTQLHVEFIRLNNGREELVALGLQKLAYAKANKPGTILIPTEFLQVGERYLISRTGRTLSMLVGKFC